MGITYPIMSSEKKSFIHAACRRVLRPLASLLLRFGMTWKEFSDLSKATFVEAASEEFGIAGRPTNVSRVSILTGISRKEVKRQRDLLANGAAPVRGKTTDATRLLSGWHQDKDFLDQNGKPLRLPEQGGEHSFEALFQRYGGDIALPTMVKELLKTGAIRRHDDGRFEVLMRYYQPAVADDENLQFAVNRIRDVIATMNNNVFADADHPPRFGGFAANDRIPRSVIAQFHAYLDVRGQAFLEEVDDWLTRHAMDVSESSEPLARVGISLFATEESIEKEIGQ